jgi:hypothetical protein
MHMQKQLYIHMHTHTSASNKIYTSTLFMGIHVHTHAHIPAVNKWIHHPSYTYPYAHTHTHTHIVLCYIHPCRAFPCMRGTQGHHRVKEKLAFRQHRLGIQWSRGYHQLQTWLRKMCAMFACVFLCMCVCVCAQFRCGLASGVCPAPSMTFMFVWVCEWVSESVSEFTGSVLTGRGSMASKHHCGNYVHSCICLYACLYVYKHTKKLYY